MHPKDADGMANSIDLIRLLLQKQSDLGLHCLLRPIPIHRICTVPFCDDYTYMHSVFCNVK